MQSGVLQDTSRSAEPAFQRRNKRAMASESLDRLKTALADRYTIERELDI